MEEREADLGPEGGISRRQALKKGAVVGGTVLWATPVIQSIGMSRAFGQQPSPVIEPGPGISFIAVRFVCGGTTFVVKLEDIDNTDTFTCLGPGEGEFCGLNLSGAVSGCGLGLFELFDIVFNPEGEVVRVSLRLTSACANGSIVAGVTKCGTSGGGCGNATINPDGTITFVC